MLKRGIGVSAILACLTLLTVSGCTQSSDGTASPSNTLPPDSPGASATPSKADGGDTAPAINNPLDVSKFLSHACLSITPDQAAELTISPKGMESGNICEWPYGNGHEIGVTYTTPDRENGLQNLYDIKARGDYNNGYFVPTTIEGYPAIYEDPRDNRQNGECSLSVGVNEQTFINILNRGEANKDLCPGAAKVANAVIETIKRG